MNFLTFISIVLWTIFVWIVTDSVMAQIEHNYKTFSLQKWVWVSILFGIAITIDIANTSIPSPAQIPIVY